MFIVGRCRTIAGYLEDTDITDVEYGLCAFVLCLSEANRMLVTKTLPHDVAYLVFVP